MHSESLCHKLAVIFPGLLFFNHIFIVSISNMDRSHSDPLSSRWTKASIDIRELQDQLSDDAQLLFLACQAYMTSLVGKRVPWSQTTEEVHPEDL